MITKDEYKALGFDLWDIVLTDKGLQDKLSKLRDERFEALKMIEYYDELPDYPEEEFEIVDGYREEFRSLNIEVQHLELLSFLREIDSSSKKLSDVVSDLEIEIFDLNEDIESAYLRDAYVTEKKKIKEREFVYAKLDRINKLKSLRELGRKNLDINSLKERAKQRAAGEKKNNKMPIKEKGRGESR